MKISSLLIGGAAAFVVSLDDGGRLPQAVGLDVEGLIAQWLPLVLGVVVAFVNESDNIPDVFKKLINWFADQKNADIDAGNKALELYHKMLELLKELQKDEDSNTQEIANLRLAMMAQHEKVVGYGPNED